MTTAIPEADPLETYESVPAVSFHEPNGGYAKGVWAKLTVRDWPKLLEQKDDDGNVERWDNGDAKLVLVVPVYDGVDESGKPVEKNLWAKKMGKKAVNSLFQAIAGAQKKVKQETGDSSFRLGPGDTLAVKFVDEDRSVPPKKGNYPKMFVAQIKPGQRPAPTAADPLQDQQGGGEDPWADSGNSSSNEPRPGASAPQQASRPGGDPFGPAAADDEPPF